jgi:hypothetical protein
VHGTESYDLCAVVVHTGNGVSSGHYVAFVRKDQSWWKCDDHSVTSLPRGWATVNRQQAYVLVYRKTQPSGNFDQIPSMLFPPAEPEPVGNATELSAFFDAITADGSRTPMVTEDATEDSDGDRDVSDGSGSGDLYGELVETELSAEAAAAALRSRGFFIENRQSHKIDVNDQELRKVDLEPIFNTDDPAEGDSSHRLQGRKVGSRVSPEVKKFEQQANEYLDRRGLRRTASENKKKTARAGNVLKSVASCSDAMQFVARGSRRYGCTQEGCKGGCTKQRFHGDAAYPKQFLRNDVPLADVPLVILYACEDNTPLHVKPFDTDEEETVILNAGDLIVFRGMTMWAV